MNRNNFIKSFKSSHTLIKLTSNAFSKDGDLLDTKTQINMMKINPSTFGYGIIYVNDSLKFADINTQYIFFSKKDIEHINEHIDDLEIISVLNDIQNKIVLANDYYDSYSNTVHKNIIVDNRDCIYLLSLRKEDNNGFIITEISTLFNVGNIKSFDINQYLVKILEFNIEGVNYNNLIYKNKKSNAFLSRFPNSSRGVNKFIATKIIAHKSNIFSKDDIAKK